MNKADVFKDELLLIKDESIRKWTELAINALPDYFFHISASSTGKYHPAYSLGEGGLVRHTRAAMRIAVELSRLDWWHFKGNELDLCLAAIAPHDGYKSGVIEEKFTRADHPNIVVTEFSKNPMLNSVLPKEDFDTIMGIISTHMGQWNRDFKTKAEILDKPVTKLQKFVHLCDYLASRKCLTMEFDVPLSRES